MNATSPIGLVCRLLNWSLGRTVRNTLSEARFKEFLNASGFLVEEVMPYGYLPRPGHLLPGVVRSVALAFRQGVQDPSHSWTAGAVVARKH